jgi:hypothetical protein
VITAARATLAKAHAAKAEDARHGAGQLSLGAQRAPTCADCDDGWERVEEIAAGADASARAAVLMADLLQDAAPASAAARAARKAARRAASAASAARRLIEERNHAYTFHTDRGFSFGEGWYLAAAAVLGGVSIQIEPGKPATRQAERFLHDAGLQDRLQPYRSRPRAMKQTTELVARAFRVDPTSAQRRLRAAFLGQAPTPAPIAAWIERKLATLPDAVPACGKVLLWIRDGSHHPGRNTSFAEIAELTKRVTQAGLVPILIGDALGGDPIPEGAVDMILFWKDPLFQGDDMRLAQLQFFEQMKERHGLLGQVGATTAGMDGPALMGLATLYLTDATNVRMREWVGAVPGYQELVREPEYLDRVSRVLASWASARGRS